MQLNIHQANKVVLSLDSFVFIDIHNLYQFCIGNDLTKNFRFHGAIASFVILDHP